MSSCVWFNSRLFYSCLFHYQIVMRALGLEPRQEEVFFNYLKNLLISKVNKLMTQMLEDTTARSVNPGLTLYKNIC